VEPSPASINLMDLDRSSMERFFVEIGEKSFRSQQVMKWIYHHGVTDFNAMTNLGKALRQRLAETSVIQPPEVVTEQTATDGTRKWLMSLGGRNAVETVYIPEPNRGTLCVSSQVGCALNCSFCSTATQGFSRNLEAAEIIGQVWTAAQQLGHDPGNRRITNVVMMGMGEPLMNFDNVTAAMSLMRDDFGFGLAGKRVTLSTAGLVPQIDRLRETIDVSLAVSLHTPFDELRNQLVPLNKKYPIKELLASCRRYVDGRKTRVTFEYTLMDGVNDSEEQARALVKLLRTVPSKLNLIPFNPFPGTSYQRSSDAVIERFQRIVLAGGIMTTVRRTRGEDIDAACGQLVGRVMDRTRRQQRHIEKLKLVANP
jgi:23S rRNA (adenine2503-C2)-methyltransferase